MSAVRDQVLDPTVKPTVAAHAATASVLRVMSQEMMRLGFADGGEVDEDWQLRRLIWLKVLARIDRKRDPRVGTVVSAIARAPEPTRAQALIASGLLDVAAGIDALAKTLAEAVTNELNGFVSDARVRSAIRQALVDLFNGKEFEAESKSTDTAIVLKHE